NLRENLSDDSQYEFFGAVRAGGVRGGAINAARDFLRLTVGFPLQVLLYTHSHLLPAPAGPAIYLKPARGTAAGHPRASVSHGPLPWLAARGRSGNVTLATFGGVYTRARV